MGMLNSHKPIEEYSHEAAASCCGSLNFLVYDKLGKPVAIYLMLQHVP